MPSKGITVWSYISVKDCVIKFSVPKNEIILNQSSNLQCKNLEVEFSNIPGPFNFTGTFRWRVELKGQEIASKYNEVNSLNGTLERGNMRCIIDTESIIVPTSNLIISYGFYDSGYEKTGLPDRHLCYITVTERQTKWMGNLAAPGSFEATKPFSRLALAAPHDVGMSQMQTTDAILRTFANDDKLLDWFFQIVPAAAGLRYLIKNALSISQLSKIAFGLAFNQKDTITTMLDMGARYFEFRPAHLHPIFQPATRLPDVPYFHHAFFPGMAYQDFLEQIVQFLITNETEIVVIHIRWDGVTEGCRHPTKRELQALMQAALGHSGIKVGDETELPKPIEALRHSNVRIICIMEMSKHDSYSDAAYQTLKVDSIINSFENMKKEEDGTHLTVLQCQGTPQGIPAVLWYSVAAADASTSACLATKALFDPTTLSWIRGKAYEKFKADKLLVVMNDFIEGATVDTAIELSRKRLAQAGQ
jgi:hypothetical protein